MATSDSTHFPEVVEEGGSATAFIPVPVPATLSCYSCTLQPRRTAGARGQGSYGGKKPHLSFVEHLRGSHNPAVQVKFRCRLCSDVFPGLRQANSHVNKLHSPSSVALLSSGALPSQSFVCTDCGSIHCTQAGLRSHHKGCSGSSRSVASPAPSPPRTPLTTAVVTSSASPSQQVTTPVVFCSPSSSAVTVSEVASTTPVVALSCPSLTTPVVTSPTAASSSMQLTVPTSPVLELTASELLGPLVAELGVEPFLPATPPRTETQVSQPAVVPSGPWLDTHDTNQRSVTEVISSATSQVNPARPALISLFESAVTQEDLDTALARFVSECSALNKIRPPSSVTSTRRPAPSLASLPPLAVQRFYDRNRKRSFEQVTGHRSPSLEIPINTLRDSLETSMGTQQFHSAHELLVRTESPDNITGEPVCPREVVARLAKAANSAPSPLDRLTYSHLRRFDKEGSLLSALFSACLRIGLTPSAWRQYVTILLFKKPREPSPEEAANPKNWRPIALLPTISKLFSGILADRLACWAAAAGAISPSQKGCYAGEGCFEHVHVLTTLRDFSSAAKPTHLAFLDLADAFTSVPHSLIFDTLRARGVSPKCILALQNLYYASSTRVSNARGESTTVPIRSGVRQGCPASPILFALAIEPILRTTFQPGSGVEVGGVEVDILAYADDLVVIASSATALQAKLDAITTRASKLGLRFNPAKCASLSWGRPSPGSSFLIDGVPFKAIQGGDFYRYLGTPIGLDRWQTNSAVLTTFREELQAITASSLRPWQKLDALRTFAFPKLSYHLRASSFQAQDLDKRKGGLDRWILRAVKRMLHLPSSACDAYLHTPRQLGGVGIPSARAELAVLKAAHAFRMATCPDPTVRALTFASLQKVISERCLIGCPSMQQYASFLNGELPIYREGRGSTWTPVLASLAFLHKSLGLRVEATGDTLALLLPSAEDSPITILAEDRGSVISILHDALGEAYCRQWKALPNQGKAAPLFAADTSALAPFDRFSRMRFCDWRFLHRARLNLIPTNSVRAAFSPGLDRRCRVCGYESETLPHVLGHCWTHSSLLNRRHNALQDEVVGAIADRPGLEVLVNRQPTLFTSTSRVDLQAVDRDRRTAVLLDFKIPFEAGPDSFAVARRRNEEKYAALAAEYRSRGFTTFLGTVCVGALGAWDPNNLLPLQHLGLRNSTIRRVATKAARNVLHWSRNIWVEHATGAPQTF